jgi:hypothetical protein
MKGLRALPALLFLVMACDAAQPAPSQDAKIATINTVTPKPAPLQPPPMLQDEAPPPKPKPLNQWHTPEPVILTRGREVRAALPFSPRSGWIRRWQQDLHPRDDADVQYRTDLLLLERGEQTDLRGEPGAGAQGGTCGCDLRVAPSEVEASSTYAARSDRRRTRTPLHAAVLLLARLRSG